MSSKDQLTATMYTFIITIIGFSSFFTSELVSGLIFIVLISFQTTINTKDFQIARCGAYIQFFIEPKIKGMKWESIIHKADEKFNKKYRVTIGNIELTRNFSKYGASIFAVMAFVSYIWSSISIKKNTIELKENAIWWMVLYFILMIFVFYLNRRGGDFQKIFDMYIEIFEEYRE